MFAHHSISLIALACFGSEALAADYPSPSIGEFRRSQFGIGCSQTTPKTDYLDCLRIGPLKIGSRSVDVESVLGKARVVRQEEGFERRFYSFDPKNPPSWYVVVSFASDRAREIQLAGKPSIGDLSFSSISIGDGTNKLAFLLGNPSSRECVSGGPYELWGYLPFPFVFRVLKGSVVAIKVTEPPDMSKPFVPLGDKEVQTPCTR
jgi:hypothetical protein